MSITLKTHKMLWGRAANRCSICRLDLVMDASETDDESVIGEACHMVAQKPDGPRGESPLTLEQRDKYSNLLLLCNVHHKLIDDQPGEYPIDKLKVIKGEHETWVKNQLSFDHQKQQDDELYAGYIEDWASRIDLDNWLGWTSWIFSNGQPSLHNEKKEALEDVRPWLLSRVWPGRYADLEAALLNFRIVSQDFCTVFLKHVERRGDEWWTEKFYRSDDWDPDRYELLSKRFDHHVGLVEDLALEMTRAANHVCHTVRRDLISSYRLHEGVALVQAGPFSDLSIKTYRVEYTPAERISVPYPGLEKFEAVRFSRNLYFGEKPAQQ